MVFLQRTEDHHLVDTIHEFGRELSSGRLDRRSIYLLIDFGIVWSLGPLAGCEPDTARNQFGHFACTKVRCHDYHRLREIDTTIVTQRKCRLIQNAEKQLPERV